MRISEPILPLNHSAMNYVSKVWGWHSPTTETRGSLVHYMALGKHDSADSIREFVEDDALWQSWSSDGTNSESDMYVLHIGSSRVTDLRTVS